MTKLAPGLLIAAPPLGDPNFERSVVLLASHDEEGAFGWILNGARVMRMSELFMRAGISEAERPCPGEVRRGGPVLEGQVWLLYPEAERLAGVEGQFQVSPGIYATASKDFLEALARGAEVPQVIGLAGYAGWGPDQLEGEIREGAWLPSSVDPEVVFQTNPRDAWQKAYERLGLIPMAFTARTVGSA